MTARMKNPAMLVTGAMDAIQALMAAAHNAGLPQATLDLVHLRASQINGCSACIDAGTQSALKAGETDARLLSVAGGRRPDGCRTRRACPRRVGDAAQ